MRQPKDNNLPFQLIHRFINFVRQTHRSEYARKYSNMMFSDNELVIISHLEQAATDLRCANPELISQAKQILAKFPFVPELANFKRFLLASIELLLIEARARRKNPALYDFLYPDTLWFFYNRSELPNEVVNEIAAYLAHGNPYESLEDVQKAEKEFEEIVADSEKSPLSVKEFIREKVWQLPDYKRKDFLRSKKVKHWIADWHAEYVKVHAYVSPRTFQTRLYEVKKEERKRTKKAQNG